MDGVLETIDGVETGNTVAPNRTAPTVAAQQCGLDERSLDTACEAYDKEWLATELHSKATAAAIEALSAQGEAEAVGYVTKDALQNFDANGTEIVDVMLYPKGTLRPENEMAVYTCPAPAPVPDAVTKALLIGRSYVLDAMRNDGGIENCEIGYRADYDVISAALASNKPVVGGLPEGTLSRHGNDVVIAYSHNDDAHKAFDILEAMLAASGEASR